MRELSTSLAEADAEAEVLGERLLSLGADLRNQTDAFVETKEARGCLFFHCVAKLSSINTISYFSSDGIKSVATESKRITEKRHSQQGNTICDVCEVRLSVFSCKIIFNVCYV